MRAAVHQRKFDAHNVTSAQTGVVSSRLYQNHTRPKNEGEEAGVSSISAQTKFIAQTNRYFRQRYWPKNLLPELEDDPLTANNLATFTQSSVRQASRLGASKLGYGRHGRQQLRMRTPDDGLTTFRKRLPQYQGPHSSMTRTFMPYLAKTKGLLNRN